MKNYGFDIPKQVMFADPDNAGEWLTGIAYNEEIICACCGAIFEIEEIIALAAEEGLQQAIYTYEDWIDISTDIRGGTLPDGLIRDDATGDIVEAGAAMFHED